MKYPEIKLTGCQIKSIRAAREVAKALDVLEERTGIRVSRITLDNCFICPDITDKELDTLNKTPMGKVLLSIIRQLAKKRKDAR